MVSQRPPCSPPTVRAPKPRRGSLAVWTRPHAVMPRVRREHYPAMYPPRRPAELADETSGWWALREQPDDGS